MRIKFSADENLLVIDGVNYMFREGTINCSRCALDGKIPQICPGVFTECGVTQHCVSSTRADFRYGHWVKARVRRNKSTGGTP